MTQIDKDLGRPRKEIEQLLAALDLVYSQYDRQLQESRRWRAQDERIRARWVEADMDDTWAEIERLRGELGFEE
jgi:hypothetical protein